MSKSENRLKAEEIVRNFCGLSRDEWISIPIHFDELVADIERALDVKDGES